MTIDHEQSSPMELEKLQQALNGLSNSTPHLRWRLDEQNRCRWNTHQELDAGDPDHDIADIAELDDHHRRLLVGITSQQNHKHHPQLVWAISRTNSLVEEQYDCRHIIPLREAATGTAILAILGRCPPSLSVDWTQTRGNISMQGAFDAETTDLEIREAVQSARDRMPELPRDSGMAHNMTRAVQYWLDERDRAADAAHWIMDAKANAQALDFIRAHRDYNQASCLESTHKRPVAYPPIVIPGGRSLKPGFLVRSGQCPTCIYHPESPNRVKNLEDRLRDDNGYLQGYRVCHCERQANICCRGFWNRNKDRFTAGQVAQRLGLVVEVESEQDAYANP